MEPPADPAFWAGRSVLVTGHTGFKGSWLAAWLTLLGARVHGFSDLPPDPSGPFDLAAHHRSPPTPGPATPGLATPGTTLGDVRDPAAVRAAVAAAAPEVVFHLAAQSLVRRSYREPVETFATNVMGTVHVLEAIRQVPGVRAAIVVTSDKCYENAETGRAFHEADRLGGHDPYASSKACCELVAAAYRSSFFATDPRGCRVATVRAGNVIGGGDWSADRLVPDVLRAHAAGKPVGIRAPGAVRPWQHVLEPLAGYLGLAQALLGPAGPALAGAWNFGPAEADCVPVGWIVERLTARLGVAWQPTAPPQFHEAGTLKVDSAKAREQLGWRPRLGVGEAVDWTADWHLRLAAGCDPAASTTSQISRYANGPWT